MADQAASPWRRLIQRGGQIITVAALIFLARELSLQWGKVSDWRPSVEQIFLLFGLSLGYAAALVLLALNWVTLLRRLVDPALPYAPLLQSYTKTQIAKYVPGNVLHFVSRHMYLKAYGLEHRHIASASGLELLSLPIAAMLAIALTYPFTGFIGLTALDAPTHLVAGIAVVLIFICAAIPTAFPKLRIYTPAALVILGRGIAFMLCQGLFFALIVYSLTGTFTSIAVPVAIFAWLIGFATPGAPGGVAIREVLIVKLMHDVAPNEDVFIAALLFRLVTTLGDIVLYVVGEFAFAKAEEQ